MRNAKQKRTTLISAIILTVLVIASVVWVSNYDVKTLLTWRQDILVNPRDALMATVPFDHSFTAIPKLLLMTYEKDHIPQKVFDDMKRYAPDYAFSMFDFDEAQHFLQEYYHPDVLKRFLAFELGAHKADLFRYALLYMYGGIYMDIKTKLTIPVDQMFTQDAHVTSVLSEVIPNTIYQGVIRAVPRHPFFLNLIAKMVYTPPHMEYHTFTAQFYDTMREWAGLSSRASLVPGLVVNPVTGFRGYLMQEKCSTDDLTFCDGSKDRYGRCCVIMDGDKRIANTRHHDFPWAKQTV